MPPCETVRHRSEHRRDSRRRAALTLVVGRRRGSERRWAQNEVSPTQAAPVLGPVLPPFRLLLADSHVPWLSMALPPTEKKLSLIRPMAPAAICSPEPVGIVMNERVMLSSDPGTVPAELTITPVLPPETVTSVSARAVCLAALIPIFESVTVLRVT